MNSELDNNSKDVLVSALKGMSGVVPYAGGMIAELIGQVIPGQRIDRIASFLKELDLRLKKLEVSREKLESEEFIDLFEDATIQAMRSLSEERTKRIASFVVNVAKDGAQFHSVDKRIIQILSDLTDDDLQVLNVVAKGAHHAQRLQHQIQGDQLTVGEYERLTSDEKDAYEVRRATWDAHVGALERLGLVRSVYEVAGANLRDIATNGRPSIRGYEITPLGRILIRRIDAAEGSLG